MIDGEDALAHDTRKMIYNHITAYPGVSFGILKNVFSLNESTLRYHLNYLERAEKIKLSLEKGKRIYYPIQSSVASPVNPSGSGSEKTYQITLLQQKILDIIKEYPGITQKELTNKIGLKRFKIVNNVKRLLNLNMIRKTPNGKNVYYEYITNDQFRYELLKGLVIKLLKKEIDEETFLKLKRQLE